MLTWYPQELQSSCVAACVRMVLSGQGREIDEAQARRLVGHARVGVSLSRATAKLKQAGFVARLYDDWSLDDLRDAVRTGLAPIVGVERQFLGYGSAFHAVVVTRVTSSAITILDPMDGPMARVHGATAFATAWREADCQALTIIL